MYVKHIDLFAIEIHWQHSNQLCFFCSETDFFFMSFVCDAFFYWINHNKFVLKLAKTLSDAHNCMRFSKLAVANTGKCLMNSCQNARAA